MALFSLLHAYGLALITPPGGGSSWEFSHPTAFVLNFYTLLLGETHDDIDSHFVTATLYVWYTFFSNIVMLNLLIAIMNNTYNDVQERIDEQLLLQRALLILEIESTMQPKRRDKVAKRLEWVHVMREPKAHLGLRDDGDSSALPVKLPDASAPATLARAEAAIQHPGTDGGGGGGGTQKLEDSVRQMRLDVDKVLDKVSALVRQQGALQTSVARGFNHAHGEDGKGEAIRQTKGALMFDLGTGETKMLVGLFRNGKVTVCEIAEIKVEVQPSRRGSVDGGAKVKPIKRQTVEIAMQYAKWREDQTRRSVSEDDDWTKVRSQVSDALKVVAERYGATVQWETGVLCATAWYRKLTAPGKESVTRYLSAIKELIENECFDLSMPMSIQLKLVSGDEEAKYEKQAVDYALRRTGRQPAPLVVGAGQGSIQIARLNPNTDAAVASFLVGLRDGEELSKKGELELFAQKIEREYADSEDVKELTDATIFRAQEAFMRPLKRDPLRLIGISGMSYVSKAAKLPQEEYLTLTVVFEALEKLLREKRDDHFNCASATRALVILRNLLKSFEREADGSDAHILFCRDWNLPDDEPDASTPSSQKPEGGAPSGATPKKEPNFRTTWSAGWWIDQLERQKARLD